MIEIYIPFQDPCHIKYEVQEIQKELMVINQQIVDRQKQVQAYKRILGLETGSEIQPLELEIFQSKWRDRAQEKNFLKSELVNIVDFCMVHDKEHFFEQPCLPSMLDTSREVLCTQGEMDFLIDLYLNYHAYMTANEKGAAKAFKDYFKLTKEYEIKLLHNNIMKDEINATRKRVKELILLSEEDKEFIAYLISLKNNRNYHQPSEEEKQVQTSNATKNKSEKNEKYKNLLEANIKENEDFQMKLNHVKSEIEAVNRRLVDAEKLCKVNGVKFRNLEKEMHGTTKMSNCAERNSFVESAKPRKQSKVEIKKTIEQYDATKRENANLKSILQQEIFLKKQDFQRFYQSLEAMAAKYRSKIIKIREQQNAASEEKKSKKKKKKSGKKK